MYLAPLKRAAVDREGTLRLEWWVGNEALKHEALPAQAANRAGGGASSVALLGNTFDVRDGLVLEGTMSLPAQANALPVGLYVGHGEDSGTAIFVDAAGVSRIGPVGRDGSGFRAEETSDRALAVGREARFRLLLKRSLLEFYLDNVLMHCHSLPGTATGRIGIIAGGRDGAVRVLGAWR